jgi:hypothetical protein
MKIIVTLKMPHRVADKSRYGAIFTIVFAALSMMLDV